MVKTKRVYKIGECLISNRTRQVYVITHIDSKNNHKGSWKLYTLKNVLHGDNYCLRAGNVRRKFKKNKVAQVLYGNNVVR